MSIAFIIAIIGMVVGIIGAFAFSVRQNPYYVDPITRIAAIATILGGLVALLGGATGLILLILGVG